MRRYLFWSKAEHATVVFSIVFLVLLILNCFNPAMGFISSVQSNWLLLLFCLCSLLNGILSAVFILKRRKLQAQHAMQERAQQKEQATHRAPLR